MGSDASSQLLQQGFINSILHLLVAHIRCVVCCAECKPCPLVFVDQMVVRREWDSVWKFDLALATYDLQLTAAPFIPKQTMRGVVLPMQVTAGVISKLFHLLSDIP